MSYGTLNAYTILMALFCFLRFILYLVFFFLSSIYQIIYLCIFKIAIIFICVFRVAVNERQESEFKIRLLFVINQNEVAFFWVVLCSFGKC